MYFISDNNIFVCGFLYLNFDKVDYDWYLVFIRRLRYIFLIFVNDFCQLIILECFQMVFMLGDFVFWFLELGLLIGDDFVEQFVSFCWVNNLNGVFLFLLVGFYFEVDFDIVLIGSLVFKYIVVVNVNWISEMSLFFVGERIMNVVFLFEGDIIYVISLVEFGVNEVIVIVLRILSC